MIECADQMDGSDDHQAKASRADELRAAIANLNVSLERIWLLHAVLEYLQGMCDAGVIFHRELEAPEYAEASERLLADLKRRAGDEVDLLEVYNREVGDDSSRENLACQAAAADEPVVKTLDELLPASKETSLQLLQEYRAVEAFAHAVRNDPGCVEAAQALEPLRRRIDALVECFFKPRKP